MEGMWLLMMTSSEAFTKLDDFVSDIQCVSEPGNPLYQMCTYHDILVYGLDVIFLSGKPTAHPS